MIGLLIEGHAGIGMAVVASVVVAWLVPAILLVLVLAGAWIGVRWAFSEELAALRSTALFSGLSTPQLRSMLRSMVPTEYPPGDTIVREGEEGHSFYLVRSGRTRLLVKGEERATLGPGTYFGEVSVIDGGVRTATVVAETKVSALELTAIGTPSCVPVGVSRWRLFAMSSRIHCSESDAANRESVSANSSRER